MVIISIPRNKNHDSVKRIYRFNETCYKTKRNLFSQILSNCNSVVYLLHEKKWTHCTRSIKHGYYVEKYEWSYSRAFSIYIFSHFWKNILLCKSNMVDIIYYEHVKWKISFVSINMECIIIILLDCWDPDSKIWWFITGNLAAMYM